MKIYLSGPISSDMTGYKSKFNAAAAKLEAQGHLVMNPAVLPIGFKWEEYLPINIEMLKACEAIYMLDGWEVSKGAQIELTEAIDRGMRVIKNEPRKAAREKHNSL